MVQELHLAANLVSGTLVYGHLQIVYEDSSGDLFETETTSSGFPYFWGDWAFTTFGRRHDDPDNTPNLDDPDRYFRVPLDLRPGQTAPHVWQLMAQIHASLSSGDHGLDYDVQQNSNSYAATVLSIVGIDIDEYLDAVMPPDVSGFPGVDTDILEGAKTGGLFSGYETPIPLALTGTAGNDVMQTGIGDDHLFGATGNDEIRAGAGADVINGAWGSDTLHGGDGRDTIFGGALNDVIDAGSERDFVNAGPGDDVVDGSSGADTLRGGGQSDTIDGGTGDDLIIGDVGTDLLVGGAGDDTFNAGGNADTLLGGEGADLLRGQDGFDVLDGGAGNGDVMTGGAGADDFVFGPRYGADTITDFDNDIDDLCLDDALWGGGLTALQVVDIYAAVDDGGTVFDFGGGDVLTVKGIDDQLMLIDDIVIA